MVKIIEDSVLTSLPTEAVLFQQNMKCSAVRERERERLALEILLVCGDWE